MTLIFSLFFSFWILAIRSAVWKFLIYSFRCEQSWTNEINLIQLSKVQTRYMKTIHSNWLLETQNRTKSILDSWRLNVINHGNFIWVKFKVNFYMLILVLVVEFSSKCFVVYSISSNWKSTIVHMILVIWLVAFRSKTCNKISTSRWNSFYCCCTC